MEFNAHSVSSAARYLVRVIMIVAFAGVGGVSLQLIHPVDPIGLCVLLQDGVPVHQEPGERRGT